MTTGVDIPIWIYYAAAAAAAAGGVVAYKGAKYQKAVAEQNEDATKQEASALAAIERAQGRKDAAAARARAGASGLGVSGSAQDVIGSLAAAGEFRAREALYQGRRRVKQFQADKVNADLSGQASLISGAGSAVTTLTAGLNSAPRPVAGQQGGP